MRLYESCLRRFEFAPWWRLHKPADLRLTKNFSFHWNVSSSWSRRTKMASERRSQIVTLSLRHKINTALLTPILPPSCSSSNDKSCPFSFDRRAQVIFATCNLDSLIQRRHSRIWPLLDGPSRSLISPAKWWWMIQHRSLCNPKLWQISKKCFNSLTLSLYISRCS